MMKIGLSIPNEPSLALTLMKQCGVEYAVSHQSLQPIDEVFMSCRGVVHG